MISLPKNPKILCIRASAVGDVLNTLPAVSAIRARYPDAFIGYIVDERSKDLIVDHPDINQVHFFPKKRFIKLLKNPLHWKTLITEVCKLRREIRKIKYDVSVDFQRNLKGGCLAVAAGAKTRVGFAPPITVEGNQYFNHINVKPPSSAKHFTEHFLALAKYLDASIEKVKFKLPKSDLSVLKITDFIQKNNLKEFVVIHPGTSEFGKLKRWPPNYFSELAQRIGKEYNLKSVVTWGPTEEDLAKIIVENSDGHAILSLKTNSLLDLVELIRKAKIFIGCDSGPMHIAGALKVSVVAIFGPKDPAIYGPYQHQKCRIVQPPQGCGPTSDISVDRVFTEVQKLI